MWMRSLVAMCVVGLLAWGVVAQEEIGLPKAAQSSHLEGVLLRRPQAVSAVIVKTDRGQWCELMEATAMRGDLHLRDMENGTRIRVTGRLDSYYYDATQNEAVTDEQSSWIIRMQVKQIQRLKPAPVLPADPLPSAEEKETSAQKD